MKFFSNYIPNKLFTVDDKDLPWTKESIKEENYGQKVCI